MMKQFFKSFRNFLNETKIEGVPAHQQSKGMCGPAALKIVTEFYGSEHTEDEIAELAGASEDHGTPAENLIDAAEQMGFTAEVFDESTIEDLSKYLEKEIPVIVDWFDEDDGHYAVCVGIDDTSIYLQDPADGHKNSIDKETFQRIWFDFPDDFIESKDDLILRRMIVVTPKEINEARAPSYSYKEPELNDAAKHNVAVLKKDFNMGHDETSDFLKGLADANFQQINKLFEIPQRATLPITKLVALEVILKELVMRTPPLTQSKIERRLGRGSFSTAYLLENKHVFKYMAPTNLSDNSKMIKWYRRVYAKTMLKKGSVTFPMIYDVGSVKQGELVKNVVNVADQNEDPRNNDIYYVEMSRVYDFGDLYSIYNISNNSASFFMDINQIFDERARRRRTPDGQKAYLDTALKELYEEHTRGNTFPRNVLLELIRTAMHHYAAFGHLEDFFERNIGYIMVEDEIKFVFFDPHFPNAFRIDDDNYS